SSPQYRAQAVPPLFSRPVGGGVWPGGTARGRVDGPGRGRDTGGHDRGAVVGGGGVSASGGLAAPTRARRGRPGGSLFPAGAGRGPAPAGQGVGAARCAEPESAVAGAGETGGSPPAAGRELRLVHRRL